MDGNKENDKGKRKRGYRIILTKRKEQNIRGCSKGVYSSGFEKTSTFWDIRQKTFYVF